MNECITNVCGSHNDSSIFYNAGRLVNIFKGAHCIVLYILGSIELYVCLLFVKIFVYTQSLNVRV
jgi:hypothetical protein